MSNDHSNKQHDTLAEHSPNQQDPGKAKASDFIVHDNGLAMAVAAHGQAGKTVAEKKKLDSETNPGFSERRSIPDRNSL